MMGECYARGAKDGYEALMFFGSIEVLQFFISFCNCVFSIEPGPKNRGDIVCALALAIGGVSFCPPNAGSSSVCSGPGKHLNAKKASQNRKATLTVWMPAFAVKSCRIAV